MAPKLQNLTKLHSYSSPTLTHNFTENFLKHFVKTEFHGKGIHLILKFNEIPSNEMTIRDIIALGISINSQYHFQTHSRMFASYKEIESTNDT